MGNLYRVIFSHPSMNALIYWNFIDGYCHRAEPGDMTAGENTYYGGLLRFDMSEKPVYKQLKKLIREEWNTSLVCSPINGKVSFRGFYGDYEAEILDDNKKSVLQFRNTRNN